MQNRVSDISLAGNTVSLGIETSSPRPTRITVEKSKEPDRGWQVAETAVVTATADKTNYVAKVRVEGDREFFRAKATPIKK